MFAPVREGGEAVDERPAPYWMVLAAAAPLAFLALQFFMVAWHRESFLGAGPLSLGGLMQVEFLVIHSTLVLGLIALWNPRDAKHAKRRAILFWSVVAMYLLFALKAGFWQLVAFVGLTLGTYLGMFFNWRSPSALLQLGARWAVSFVLFLLCTGVFGTPTNVEDWAGNGAVLRAGAAYFFLLAAVELSGFYLRVLPLHARAFNEAVRRRQA